MTDDSTQHDLSTLEGRADAGLKGDAYLYGTVTQAPEGAALPLDIVSDEMPVRKPGAPFGIEPLPEELPEDSPALDEQGHPVGSVGEHPTGPHVHIVTINKGTTLRDLFSAIDQAHSAQADPINKSKSASEELDRVFPDTSIRITVVLPGGKRVSASIDAPLPDAADAGFRAVYHNQLHVESLFEAVVHKVRAELQLETTRLRSLHLMDERCQPTGGFEATWNGIMDKHASDSPGSLKDQANL